MVPYLSMTSTAATVVAAVAAIASLCAVRTANRTAESASRTAESLGDLERQRRHAELTPKFEIYLDGRPGSSQRLWVRLTGPSGLDRLDKLTISIRDNNLDITGNPDHRPTSEDAENQILGPYRFEQAISRVTGNQRSVVMTVPFLLGDDCAFMLEETPPPTSHSGERASWPYSSKQNKLTLLCERGGYEPWTVPVESPDYLN